MASSRPQSRWPIGPLTALVAVALGAGFAQTRPKSPQPPLAKIDTAPTGALPPRDFGQLSAPALPQTAALPQEAFAPAMLARFTAAAALYRKGVFPADDGVSDPIARAGLDWMALRVAPTPARLDAFAKAHPDWPAAGWRHSRSSVRSRTAAWVRGRPAPSSAFERGTPGARPRARSRQ